jgi:hypothetical protein
MGMMEPGEYETPAYIEHHTPGKRLRLGWKRGSHVVELPTEILMQVRDFQGAMSFPRSEATL